MADAPAYASLLPPGVAAAWLTERDLPDHPLHPGEEALVSPRAIDSYRRDVRLGRGAARVALRALGVADAAIGRGELREPLWPAGFAGAITHSGGYAMAAVARSGDFVGVGVDLESLERAGDLDGVGRRIARPSELRWIEGHPAGPARRRAVLELFSAKESVFKAFFPQIGEYFGFEAATLVPLGPGVGSPGGPGGSGGGFAGRLEPPFAGVRGGSDFVVRSLWWRDMVLTALTVPA